MRTPANVTLVGAEHHELMRSFEALRPGRIDKEPREMWSKGIIYADGVVNALFLMYRHGVSRGLAMAQDREIV